MDRNGAVGKSVTHPALSVRVRVNGSRNGTGLEGNWETLVKAVRLSGLAASTALALILALSSQPGWAQSTSDGSIQAAPQATAPVQGAAAKPAEQTSQALPTVKVPLPHIVAPTEKDVHFAAPADAKTVSAPAKTPAATPSATASIPKATTPTDKAAAPTAAATKPAAAPATQQATVTPPQATPAVAESAVADALKSAIVDRLDRYVPRKDDRAGVEAFYKKRDYKPLWVANGTADPRAKAAIDYLASVAADGLNPSDYPTPNFDAKSSAGDLAAAELALTNAVLIYAHDAQVGRIHFSRIGSDISFKLNAPEPAAVLAKMAEAKDVAAALDGYNPPQPGFKALKAKLAELRKGEKPAQAQRRRSCAFRAATSCARA